MLLVSIVVVEIVAYSIFYSVLLEDNVDKFWQWLIFSVSIVIGIPLGYLSYK